MSSGGAGSAILCAMIHAGSVPATGIQTTARHARCRSRRRRQESIEKRAAMLDYDTVTATATISLAGDYDMANKQQILDQVAAVLALDGVRDVILNMSAVTFLDSTALGAMVESRRICQLKGKRLIVRDAAPRVVRVLRVTGTHDLFLLDQAVDEAPDNAAD